MTVNRMAGCCLILFGIINVLHEIHLNSTGRGRPGLVYAIITAALFAVGTALLLRPGHKQSQQPASKLNKD
jgi:hypothetical protein